MILVLLAACVAEPTGSTPRGALALGFPLPERDLFSQVIGMDHDPIDHDGVLGDAICTAFDGSGFPSCYDEHRGTDYLLKGGFDTMDAGSTPVVAAASGLVVSVADGNYDRCHASGTGISCDGHEMRANHVVIAHMEGVFTRYWHLRSGSVEVEVGQWVACGDQLGLVGSSGISSKPHLHFELDAADLEPIDPYAGPASQPESWWSGQVAHDGLPEAGCAAR